MNILSEMRFGKVADGLVRLGINGQLAVKTGSDYKYYDPKTNRLVNCDNFVFDVGSEFFFVMPTNKVKAGDIILTGGKPAYVLAPESNGEIKILSYEDASIKLILPERHTFLGQMYMYSKIVSMFGNKALNKNTLMKYMMFNTVFGNKNATAMSSGLTSNNMFGNMSPMMLMMMCGDENPFTSMFDFDGEGMFDGLFAEEDDVDKEAAKEVD